MFPISNCPCVVNSGVDIGSMESKFVFKHEKETTVCKGPRHTLTFTQGKKIQ